MDIKDTTDPTLAAHFDALRHELAGQNTPRCVEKELMQAFARQFPPAKRWYRQMTAPQWGAAGAACSMAVLVLLLVLAPHRFDNRVPTQGTPLAGSDNGIAFIALESLERIEQEPAPQLVEAEVPRTMLAPLGLPVTPENAGEPMLAEMLVAADGQPLALRLSSL